jgi:hypothetical protein
MNKEPEYLIENSPYVVELSEYIEQVLTEKPDKRKKKVYEEWLKEVNKLIKKCNTLANHPIYATIKS